MMLPGSTFKQPNNGKRRSMISGLGRGSMLLEIWCICGTVPKKKDRVQKLQAPWKGPFVISASCGPVLYEVQGLRQKRIMHHDRLKPYDCEVIPAGVRRQRSEILQKSKDTPDNPIMQEPLHEPEPPASQGSSETGRTRNLRRNQDKERKRQPAARRRRKKLGLGLMSDIGGPETIKRTHKGREIRKPARYNS